ncbi:DUF862 domain-containing protein [Citrus sinensis]|nr:DUF862 domain-containing protein [Citrus sinensis]
MNEKHFDQSVGTGPTCSLLCIISKHFAFFYQKKAEDRIPCNGKIGILSSKNHCTGKIAISSSNRNGSLQTNQDMASEPADIVLDLVGEKLRRLTATPSDQFNIFKVPDVLRKLNEKAYEPEMLAIGPYHHGKEQLLGFEEHKTRYLKKLLERTSIPLSDYVMAMRALEERARKCYGRSISLNRDEFVQMMLLDGCFIVELICKFSRHPRHLRGDDDPNFKLGVDAYRNNATNNRYWSFIGSATEIQEAGIHFRKVEVLKDDSLFDIKFENGVMKMPSLEIGDATETILQNFIAYEQCSQDLNPKHVIDFVEFLNCLIKSSKDAELLRRRGIIENLLGDDEVIATLLNKLSDRLVHGDAQFYVMPLLRPLETESSAHICSVCVILEPFGRLPYATWLDDILGRPRNQWMVVLRRRLENLRAWLRHNYFSTGLAIISFVGAVVLLLLTLLQALFAVLSYYQQAPSH